MAALDRVLTDRYRLSYSRRQCSADLELRAAFAARMAAVYGREVPAYTTLVEVAEAVNVAGRRARRRRPSGSARSRA